MAKKKKYTVAELSTNKVDELRKIATSVGIKNVKSYKKTLLVKKLIGLDIGPEEATTKETTKKAVEKVIEKPIKVETKKAEKPKEVKKPKKKKKTEKVDDEAKLLMFRKRNSSRRSSMTWK